MSSFINKGVFPLPHHAKHCGTVHLKLGNDIMEDKKKANMPIFRLSLIIGIMVLLCGCASTSTHYTQNTKPDLGHHYRYAGLDLSKAGAGVISNIV